MLVKITMDGYQIPDSRFQKRKLKYFVGRKALKKTHNRSRSMPSVSLFHILISSLEKKKHKKKRHQKEKK